MALYIDDAEIESLAREIGTEMGVEPVEAIRILLERRRDAMQKKADALAWLQAEVWPRIPPEQLGKPVTRAERAEILGYGLEGV